MARQNGGPGLFGTDVTGPSAAPTNFLGDASGDALFNVIGGTNRTSLDIISQQLALSGSTLTVTLKVADLRGATVATDMQNITGTAFQQYVTRWQMGNTIYYAMMETNGAQRTTGTDQYFAGAAQSIDLCSVSACFPHVIIYPEAGTTAHNESGGVVCPTTPLPSATNPCTRHDGNQCRRRGHAEQQQPARGGGFLRSSGGTSPAGFNQQRAGGG